MNRSHTHGLDEVADRLVLVAPDLVERQLAALRKFSSYDRVPQEGLHRSALRNVYRVAQILRGKALLPDDVSEDEHASGVQRALQGIPAEEVVAVYRAVMGVLRDAYFDAAAHADIAADTVLDGTRRLWELTDRYSNELVAARNQIDLDIARREERQRLGFLQRVLTGNLLDTELHQGGAAYGLAPDSQYWVVRARHPEGRLQGLSRRIEDAAAGPHSAPLLGPIDGDLAGLTVRRPIVDVAETGTIATVGPVNLSQLSHAFAEATRLLNVAVRYQRRGLIDQAAMSIRIAVVEEHEIGQVLFERYVQPVLRTGPIAEVILGSVRAFLVHKRRIQAAAEALSVHQNTLRYRLAKYEEMTGADLTETETIIESWWALEYWEVHRKTTSMVDLPTPSA